MAGRCLADQQSDSTPLLSGLAAIEAALLIRTHFTATAVSIPAVVERSADLDQRRPLIAGQLLHGLARHSAEICKRRIWPPLVLEPGPIVLSLP